MASIRKRNGKWQVQIRRHGVKPIARSFTKLTDAKEWANHMECQADRHSLPADPKQLERTTLRALLTRYKKEVVAYKKGKDIEDIVIDAFLKKSGLADLPLSGLTAEHFSEYRDKRLRKVKPATICRELGVIQHALDTARKEWSIPLQSNPLSTIRKPRINNRRERRLAQEEYQALHNAAKKCRNKHVPVVIEFAIETAMRRGEILNVKWKDVDFKAQTLHIPEAKNGHSRTIPLTPKALKILELRREKDRSRDHSRVFPISADSLKKAWQRLVKRSGLENLHFHDLRHEAISRFFEMGLSIPEVALISGHKDFRMLFRYTHLRAEDVGKKINKIQ